MTIYLENGNGIVGPREYKALIEDRDCRVCQYAVNIDRCTIAFCNFKPSAPVLNSQESLQYLIKRLLIRELSQIDYEKFCNYCKVKEFKNYTSIEFSEDIVNLLKDKYNIDIKGRFNDEDI